MNLDESVIGWGIRVFRNDNGTVTIVPPGVDYQGKPEEEIKQVKDIYISMVLGMPITAIIEIIPSFNNILQALPVIAVKNENGEIKRIKLVIFEDGSILEQKMYEPD